MLTYELLEGGTIDEVLAWLRERVSDPLDIFGTLLGAQSGPRLYGRVDAKAVWLGVLRPGRRRPAQRLFRGRLSQRAGRWRLEGHMRLTLDGWSRVLLLPAPGVAGLLVEPGAFTAAAFAGGALLSAWLWAGSIAGGREDAEIIAQLLQVE